MADIIINPDEPGHATVVYDNISKQIITVCYKTDAVTESGRITTTINTETSTSGDVSVTMNTTHTTRVFEDATTCVELKDFARDNLVHWAKVYETLQEIADSLVPPSNE